MEAQKVDMYIMANAKYFDSGQIPAIRERLLQASDDKWIFIQSLEMKDPTTILIVSIVAGNLGIDRFMMGDTGLGVGKLLTCGGLGIWAIVDWFLVMGDTRQQNGQKLANALM